MQHRINSLFPPSPKLDTKIVIEARQFLIKRARHFMPSNKSVQKRKPSVESTYKPNKIDKTIPFLVELKPNRFYTCQSSRKLS